MNCPGGGIGRHKGLKIPRQQYRAGSSPAPGTKFLVQQKMILTKKFIVKKIKEQDKLKKYIDQ